MPRKRPQLKLQSTPPSSLVEVWYDRLRESGFEDIEDVGSTPHSRKITAPVYRKRSMGVTQDFKQSDGDVPLKDWHSFSFTSIESQMRKQAREVYQAQIDTFANSPEFPEIIALMVRHGNNLYDTQGIERIWDLHRNGITERGIALEMSCSQSCIHFMLKRMREWMKLTV